jgi:hypothetical protein
VKHFLMSAVLALAGLLLIAAALTLPGVMGTTRAEAAVTTDISVSVAGLPVFVPCAADGAGEVVLLSGNIHMLFTLTADGAGGTHASFHANPQGVTGIGQTTGAKYQGTGVTRGGNFNVYPTLPFEATFVDNFRIIGQGAGNNLLLHAITHVTVNANGDTTASVDQASIDCK